MIPMDCRTTKEELHALLDNELDPDRVGDQRRHLAACPECAAEEKKLLRLHDLLRHMPCISLPAGFTAQTLRRALQRSEDPGFLEWWRSLSQSWRWAVCTATLAGLLAGVLLSLPAADIRTPPTFNRSHARLLFSDASLLEDYPRTLFQETQP